MIMNLDALVGWSRAQFALTAMYHWLFVPLTLGLGVIMAIVETIYYRNGKPEWKRYAQFWQKLFGINFAIGVATGIILEFEFGTNWSNYSLFVGDIFGAPLAIEGILAFFMEATFIAVMFFGWNKVSRGFHLVSTWLVIIGASISAVWILIANAWMQEPIGMTFNPDTMRNEMSDFWALVFSSTAINKFWHTITSCWTLGSVFALGVCGIYLLRKDCKHKEFALKNVKIIAPFGLVASLLTAYTGDTSAYNVAQKQPMKLAAMEALYDAGETDAQGLTADGKGLPLSVFGVLNPAKKSPQSIQDAFLFNIEVPRVLSILGTRNPSGYVPGINNILEGGYMKPDGTMAVSVDTMMMRGRKAIMALNEYSLAKQVGNEEAAEEYKAIIDENYPYFGYGYIKDKNEVVPPVGITYYSFRIMVGLGMLFILVFLVAWLLSFKPEKLGRMRWFHIVTIVCMPFAWMASQSGWIVAEVGRQPWTIQNLLPVQAAVSKLEVSSVVITFFVFLVLFTALLIAEVNIMRKAIKKGPETESH
ncbi:cytochrome ubiquinol oxidase subunit I [Porphyromonas loveana]|uniref:cytochrome ubiquinol oxidase subunit I n=1 Tax=Porphyromonas loveana TaxID=1884669 RepID=UPI0035A11516